LLHAAFPDFNPFREHQKGAIDTDAEGNPLPKRTFKHFRDLPGAPKDAAALQAKVDASKDAIEASRIALATKLDLTHGAVVSDTRAVQTGAGQIVELSMFSGFGVLGGLAYWDAKIR